MLFRNEEKKPNSLSLRAQSWHGAGRRLQESPARPLCPAGEETGTQGPGALPRSHTAGAGQGCAIRLLFSHSVGLTLWTPWTVARQAPLSTGFPRQECWRGFACPSPGDLPDPRNQTCFSCLAGGFFTSEPPGKPKLIKCLSVTKSCPTLLQPRGLSPTICGSKGGADSKLSVFQ